ncbi:ATP-binding protein [Viridibacillus sp. NPDC096237]|uniref:ATP-binding protein n=1 Tax=Viridibacillus sp. NPDC096237 TaxID=3390721 RepID=UPI003CFE7845
MYKTYIRNNQRVYFFTVLLVITLMTMGLLIKNPLDGELGIGCAIQFIFVVIISISLLLYPKYGTHGFRTIIIIEAFIYFYNIFFLYPETWSNFIFLCFIPAVAIMFFDSKLFYFSLVINAILIAFTFGFIALIDQGDLYIYINQDLVGNGFNYLASQVLIYFIYYLTNMRIKKQELYYEQVKEAERLKTAGQLAAAVAHEIRNPVTVVKGFLQLYERDPQFNDAVKSQFTLMIDELNTAESVVSQFLSIAKPEKNLNIELVNLKVVLQSVTDLLNSYGLLNNNNIELDITEDCYIAANNIELKQLLINVIKNAIEASDIGDSVIVKGGKKKDFVEIQVIDHGRGMSEKEVECLGTPFYSLKSKGTGLGMMICFNIAAKYKGTIDFQSSINEGTTVTICFPSENNAGK